MLQGGSEGRGCEPGVVPPLVRHHGVRFPLYKNRLVSQNIHE